MNTYTQLTQEQRYQIYALLKMGHNQTEMADMLSVHKSTLSRELRRNRGQRGYRPQQAHRLALSRRQKAKRRIAAQTWAVVDGKLRQEWSPEQISAWLQKNVGVQVSHEWIYQHILANKRAGGELYRHLRCQKKRRKRYGSYERRGQIPNRVSIEQRPALVEQRARIGDWEADTIIGKGQRQAIVTLVERKSRFTLMHKIQRRTAAAVQQALRACNSCVPTVRKRSPSPATTVRLGGLLIIKRSRLSFKPRCSLPIRTHLGNAAAMRTPMVSSASISQKVLISQLSPPRKSLLFMSV